MSRRAIMGLGALFLLTACQTTQTAQAPSVPPPPPAEPDRIVLSADDQVHLTAALMRASAKPVDEVVGWANPADGKQGAVKILRDGYDERNRPCREFHSYVVQKKLELHATGFICRQPDGAWQVEQVREYPQPTKAGA